MMNDGSISTDSEQMASILRGELVEKAYNDPVNVGPNILQNKKSAIDESIKRHTHPDQEASGQ